MKTAHAEYEITVNSEDAKERALERRDRFAAGWRVAFAREATNDHITLWRRELRPARAL